MGNFNLFGGKKNEHLISVKGFEETNFKNLKDYYSNSIIINNHEVNIDLNFDNKITNNEELKTVDDFIKNLDNLDKKNLESIVKDFQTANSIVKEYLDHHISEIQNKELSQLIDLKDTSKTKEQKLLEKIKLHRVGIYPNDTNFTTFDYIIGEDITQYLIVIRRNKSGKIIDITTES